MSSRHSLSTSRAAFTSPLSFASSQSLQLRRLLPRRKQAAPRHRAPRSRIGRDRSARRWHGLLVSFVETCSTADTHGERATKTLNGPIQRGAVLGLRLKLCCHNKNVMSNHKVSFDLLLGLSAASSSFGRTARLNQFVQLLKTFLQISHESENFIWLHLRLLEGYRFRALENNCKRIVRRKTSEKPWWQLVLPGLPTCNCSRHSAPKVGDLPIHSSLSWTQTEDFEELSWSLDWLSPWCHYSLESMLAWSDALSWVYHWVQQQLCSWNESLCH